MNKRTVANFLSILSFKENYYIFINKMDYFSVQITGYISCLVHSWCSLGTLLLLSIIAGKQCYVQFQFANVNTFSFSWLHIYKYI